jgi:hypothetical protein
MNEDTASPACDRNGVSTNGKPAPGDGGGTFETCPTIREIADGVFTRQEPASLSPSLWRNREEPAFELKFQLPEEQARSVAAWARQHLNLDPYGVPELDHAYLVHGLYFDTPALDVYHRSPGYKRKKYRLRRYGSGVLVFLEQKRKSAGRVAKRRVQIDEAELERLRETPIELAWHGAWFHRRISVRKLQPSCLISYERQAYFGQNGEGPLRLTLDRRVRSQLADRWAVEEIADGLPILTDQVLLELKFRRHLPALFKGLMQDFSLTPGPLSKYRLAIQALGRAVVGGGAADA